jgi:ribose 5-phosphate isomerase B
MRIAIGCDDAGFPVKTPLITALESEGHVVLDLGCFSTDPVDYPDYARVVGQAVLRGFADAGVLVCGSATGASIAANKVAGVRAANCRDVIDAELSRRHNDANVMCLSADLIGEEQIEKMVKTWLTTDFEGGRHARRTEKIVAYEKNHTEGT